ncbi:MAG: hypothetical protein ACHQ17_06090, partial [Polyangia bacterium]
MTLHPGTHLTIDGMQVSGNLNATFGLGPVFKDTSVALEYQEKRLSTTEDIHLELTDAYKTHFDGSVDFGFSGGQVHGHGEITKLNGLGMIGDDFEKATVDFDHDAGLKIHGAWKLKGLPDVKPESELTLGYESKQASISGVIALKDVDGVAHFTESQINVDWRQGSPLTITGSSTADVDKFAEVNLEVDQQAGGGQPAGLDLKGKLTAEGMNRYFKGVTFGQVPNAEFFARVQKGQRMDLGIPAASCTIIELPGVGACDIGLSGSYTKGEGLSGSIDVRQVKIAGVTITGQASLEKNRFGGGSLNVAADMPGLKLNGPAEILKGAELHELDSTAKLTLTPTEGGGLGSWVDSAEVGVTLKKWKLDEAHGAIHLKPPGFLPLKDPTVQVGYQKNTGLSAILKTSFASPIPKYTGDGTFVAGYEQGRGLFAHVEFPIMVPGFQQGTVSGDVDGEHIHVGAELVPNQNEILKKGNLDIGYQAGSGFFVRATVTIAPSESLELEVGAEYSQQNGFQIVGLTPNEKHEDNEDHSLAHFGEQFPTIPLLTVGVASLGLSFGMGIDAGYRMPKVKFQNPKIEGGLDALGEGGLPNITFGGSLSMAAYLELSFNVQIVGEIQLLIASAKAGIGAEIAARLELALGADITGSFKKGEGARLSIDPFVSAQLALIASLIATLYAEVCWFTIIDKKYTLASAEFARIDLGSFKPFEPIELQLGGPGGTRFLNGLHLRKDTSKMQEGVKEGGKKSADAQANKEAKEKIAPVLKTFKSAAHQFEELPEGWQNGMTVAPVDFESMFGISGKAWDFYTEHADNAEEIDPEDACTTPTEKLAKAVAVMSKRNPMMAGGLILSWRRAQIAHQGINPDTGEDVVAYQKQVVQARDALEAKQVAEWQKAVVDLETRHQTAVVKQKTDFAGAQKQHEARAAHTGQDFAAKTQHHQEEGNAEQQRLLAVSKETDRRHAGHTPTAHEKAAPPRPPAAPPMPRPLAPPVPLPPPPPIPQPAPVAAVPEVTLPALPADPGASAPSMGVVPKAQPAAAPAAPAPKPSAAAPPPSTPAPTGQSASQQKGKTSGQPLADKGPESPSPRKSPSTMPGPTVAAGPSGITSQDQSLHQRLTQLGGGAALGGAPGAKAGPAAPPAAPAPGGKATGGPPAAPGADAKAPGGKAAPDAHGGKGAHSAAPVDPSV